VPLTEPDADTSIEERFFRHCKYKGGPGGFHPARIFMRLRGFAT
jgi:hypothetical protein